MSPFVIPEPHMGADNLTVELNTPARVGQRFQDGVEVVGGLPSYAPCPHVYNVDDWPDAPKTWMRGGPKAKGYFAGVKRDHGLWLDLNGCRNHSHDVAALISIQGVNAVTGMPTAGIFLERYVERCPRHDQVFGADRFCEACGYCWPPQNYLATTGTPAGLFWLDGFRAADGIVRQFYFTDDVARGVAANILGDARVFAIGVSFFTSREPKPIPVRHTILRSAGLGTLGFSKKSLGGLCGAAGAATPRNPHGITINEIVGASDATMDWSFVPVSATMSATPKPATVYSVNACNTIHPDSAKEEYSEQSVADTFTAMNATLEIAAGARINQPVHQDPRDLGYWNTEPAMTVYLNYATEAFVIDLVTKSKRRDRTAGQEGWLAPIPKGDPAHKQL